MRSLPTRLAPTAGTNTPCQIACSPIERGSPQLDAGVVHDDFGRETTLFELLIVYVFILVFAFFVARLAKRKGYSFGLFFVFFLILCPAGLLVALALPDKRRPPAAATPDA